MKKVAVVAEGVVEQTKEVEAAAVAAVVLLW